MEEDYVEINGEKIYFYYKRKKIKNIIMKINKENKIIISLPKKEAISNAKKFIIKKYNWIEKIKATNTKYEKLVENKEFVSGQNLYLFGKPHIMQIKEDIDNNIEVKENIIEIQIKKGHIENKKYIEKVYEKWLRSISEKEFIKIIDKFQKLTEKEGIPYPEMTVRKMKSRWGSCYPKKKKIILNLSLTKTPVECIEYVILHELSHFKYQNHSKKFYTFIEKFMPDWKERRNLLNKVYTKIII